MESGIGKAERGGRVALHVVNKNISLAVPPDERTIKPVEDLELSVPLPVGGEVLRAGVYRPGGAPAATASATVRSACCAS